MTVEYAGESAAIRFRIPNLNVARYAEDQIDAIKKGIATAGNIHPWVWHNLVELEGILASSPIPT